MGSIDRKTNKRSKKPKEQIVLALRLAVAAILARDTAAHVKLVLTVRARVPVDAHAPKWRKNSLGSIYYLFFCNSE